MLLAIGLLRHGLAHDQLRLVDRHLHAGGE
jgi:hypothetical protein